jgi:hypothetical protein
MIEISDDILSHMCILSWLLFTQAEEEGNTIPLTASNATSWQLPNANALYTLVSPVGLFLAQGIDVHRGWLSIHPLLDITILAFDLRLSYSSFFDASFRAVVQSANSGGGKRIFAHVTGPPWMDCCR